MLLALSMLRGSSFFKVRLTALLVTVLLPVTTLAPGVPVLGDTVTIAGSGLAAMDGRPWRPVRATRVESGRIHGS